MASSISYEPSERDKLAVAESLVLAHRHARPVVREIRPAFLLVEAPAPAVPVAVAPVLAVPTAQPVPRLRSPGERTRWARRPRHARVRGYLQRLATS